MEEHFYGLNFQIIPQDVVIHDCCLNNLDIIENQDGVLLMYLSAFKGFQIVSGDPSKYLSSDQIYSQWKLI